MLNCFKDWLGAITIEEFTFTEINGIKYPAPKTIIHLHKFLIQAFNDADKVHPGIYSDASLEFYGIKYYMPSTGSLAEDIINRGACILNKFLEENHPFVDGNKRAGFVTLWLFLILNKVKLDVDALEYKKHSAMLERWADKKPDVNNIGEIIEWIMKHAIIEESYFANSLSKE